MRPLLFLLILVLAIPSTALAGPSFDCAKATRQAERLVCEEPALAALDRQLAETYAARLRAVPDEADAVRQRQRRWLRFRDAENAVPPTAANRADKVEGLRLAYEWRIRDIQEPGEDEIVRLDPRSRNMRGHGLWMLGLSLMRFDGVPGVVPVEDTGTTIDREAADFYAGRVLRLRQPRALGEPFCGNDVIRWISVGGVTAVNVALFTIADIADYRGDGPGLCSGATFDYALP